jgi:hypothetical protein
MTDFDHRPVHDTEAIARHYTEKDGVPVRYVCTTALGDAAIAFDIFYRDTPHPEFGNRYFGIYDNPVHGRVCITNADEIEDYEFKCGVTEDDRLVYSQHRHDLVEVDGGALDGGRSYTRVIGDVGILNARVKDGMMYTL